MATKKRISPIRLSPEAIEIIKGWCRPGQSMSGAIIERGNQTPALGDNTIENKEAHDES